MSRRFDADAARAARLEEAGEPPVFVFGGEEFVLPVEMPWAFVVGSTADADGVGKALTLLLGDRAEVFWAADPSDKDIAGIVEFVMAEYGVGSLPESEASSVSSLPTGRRSRPTSSGSTGSTSPRRAGGGRR